MRSCCATRGKRLPPSIRADLPVILYSGNTTAIVESAQAAGIREVLEKPVSLNELGGAVRKVLA